MEQSKIIKALEMYHCLLSLCRYTTVLLAGGRPLGRYLRSLSNCTIHLLGGRLPVGGSGVPSKASLSPHYSAPLLNT